MESSDREQRCHAVVLAGGQSRRMGRRKELLDTAGEPNLLRAVRQLEKVAAAVTVVTDDRQTYPFLPAQTRLLRDIEPDCGPVGGICTGMRADDSELQLVTGCDYPLLEPRVWLRMLQQLAADPGSDAVVPLALGKLHPLCAVYRRRTLPLWEAALACRELRVMRAVGGMRVAEFEPGEDEPLFVNMNTPEEYRQVKERLGP